MKYYKVEESLVNLANDNVKKIESIFPSVVKDGEVDFEELRELLGNLKEVDKEKYEMNWVGKKEAKKIALSPLYGKTLKYIEGDGKNEDTTENLYIEGDNLEVLKLLQNSYYGKVKMIYIDPPYNTGNDFIYNDNFKDEKIKIDIVEGNRDEYGKRLVKNQSSGSHYHSKWLNMMYSRLLICKNLLVEDGLIFVSIDDNELDNLKKVMDEIFGEMNFMGRIMPIVNPGGRDYKQIAVTNEYLLVYSKSDLSIIQEISKDIEFKFSDSLGGYELRDLRNRNPKFHSGNRPNLFYPFYVNSNIKDKYGFYSVSLSKGNGYDIEIKPYNSEGKESVWRWGVSKSKENINLNNIEKSQVVAKQKNDGGWIILEKNRRCTTKIKSIWDGNEMRTEEGTRSIRNLFGFTPFDHTKPVGFIKRILEISDNSGIILDFFSGSSATAHAIMELNAIDNSNRKYIMVQIPEATNNNSEAYKRGYKNICQIGKDRIRKAGDKIVEENKDNPQISNLDIGFKVFRVEDSNIRWENQTNENNQFKYNLDGVDIDDIDFMPNTKDIDVVYEILLRHYGIPLTAKINKLDYIGNRTYTIEDSIIVCLETKITQDIIDKISELEPIKVIFRDSAFGDDISLKQNSIHRLNVLIEKNNKNTTHVVEFI